MSRDSYPQEVSNESSCHSNALGGFFLVGKNKTQKRSWRGLEGSFIGRKLFCDGCCPACLLSTDSTAHCKQRKEWFLKKGWSFLCRWSWDLLLCSSLYCTIWCNIVPGIHGLLHLFKLQMNNVTWVVLWVSESISCMPQLGGDFWPTFFFSELLRSSLVREHALSLQKLLTVVGIIHCVVTLSYYQRCWQIYCPARTPFDKLMQSGWRILQGGEINQPNSGSYLHILDGASFGMAEFWWTGSVGLKMGVKSEPITVQQVSSCFSGMTCRCFYRERRKEVTHPRPSYEILKGWGRILKLLEWK